MVRASMQLKNDVFELTPSNFHHVSSTQITFELFDIQGFKSSIMAQPLIPAGVLVATWACGRLPLGSKQ